MKSTQAGSNTCFDLIDVSHFTNHRVGTVFHYILLLCGLLLHTALYAVDVYTCIKLLAFNEWSSEVKPYLSFKISKWLFGGCIIMSFVLLVFDMIRGIRVYRTKNISLIYINKFARVTKSLAGYRYFCVLDKINPQDRFDKLCFFTYFTLVNSKKLILADSPRQVINAMTLYSVLNMDNGTGSFWTTIKTISETSSNEAIILYLMTISICIWAFFILELFFAVMFLWPVLYKLKKLQYGLKNFVIIKVDKTVIKLANKYAKKSLLKQQQELSKRKFTATDLSIEEKPRIPNIPTPITPHDFTKPYTRAQIPKVGTMDSIATYNSASSHGSNSSNNPFLDKKPNPFTDSHEILSRPLEQIHPKPASTHHLLNKSYTDPDMINKPLLMSQSNLSLTSVPLRSIPDSRNNSTTSFQSNAFPKRSIFIDEEQSMGLDDDDEIDLSSSDEEDDDDDDDEDPLDNEPSPPVRSSLIVRAQDMQFEDYSRYKK